MLKQTTRTLQDQLFGRIKEILPPGKSLADVVADVLHLSTDSAYRRIRGETLLVLDEARELCLQFGLSLDDLFALKNSSIVFHRTEIDATAYDFTSYLKGLLSLLKQLASHREKSILYLTKGIPLFHLFPFRPLLAFRYYFWMRTTFEVPEMLQQKFAVSLLPPETEAVGNEILSLYNNIPSNEIWSTENLNSTLLQIDFCRDAGLMTSQQALEVINSLEQLLAHLQLQAEWGRKFSPTENPQIRKDNFQLFHNRLGLGNDIVLTTQEGRKTLYLNNDALDYLTCTDEAYCNKMCQKLQSILRRSTLISSVSERERGKFFQELHSRVATAKDRLFT